MISASDNTDGRLTEKQLPLPKALGVARCFSASQNGSCKARNTSSSSATGERASRGSIALFSATVMPGIACSSHTDHEIRDGSRLNRYLELFASRADENHQAIPSDLQLDQFVLGIRPIEQ